MAWVKVTNVSNALIPPIITVEPSTPNGIGKWYKRTEDDKEMALKVTIETNSPSADRIMYTVSGAHNETKDETNPSMGKTVTFEIKETGRTNIIAKTGSVDGYESKETQKEIKLDNIKPEITKVELEPTPGKADKEGKSWIQISGEIKVEAKDTNGNTNPEEIGKISGYEYTVKNLKTNETIVNNKLIDNIETKIKITTDGEYLIEIQAIDEAGNRSETSTVNVYKDGEAPEIGTAEVTDGTSDGFFVQVGARDEVSGLRKTRMLCR